MSFSWWGSVLLPLIVALLAGGVVSTAVSVWLEPTRLRPHEQSDERAEARHAERTRAEAAQRAHEDAARQHAAAVSQVYFLLNSIAADVLGPEVGYYDPESTSEPILERARTAIGCLRGVWTSHPTRLVRVHAKKLYEDLQSFYGEPPPDPDDWPSSARDGALLLGHSQMAERLVEILHSPIVELD